MMTGWVLVIAGFAHGYLTTYEKIPMQSQEACMVARNIVMDNGIADKAICVPTGYGEK